jgi:hypothetical protein
MRRIERCNMNQRAAISDMRRMVNSSFVKTLLLFKLCLVSFVVALLNAGCNRSSTGSFPQTLLTRSVGPIFVSALADDGDESRTSLNFRNEGNAVPSVTCVVTVETVGTDGNPIEKQETVKLQMYPNSSTTIAVCRDDKHEKILRIETLTYK